MSVVTDPELVAVHLPTLDDRPAAGRKQRGCTLIVSAPLETAVRDRIISAHGSWAFTELPSSLVHTTGS
jgi:hypothetical protein